MSRVYEIPFEGVTLAAVQDLFSVQASANMFYEVISLQLGQVTQQTISGLKVRLRRAASGFTVGSGGSVATPNPRYPNDVASAVTARVNDTTQMTGTFVDLMAMTWDLPFSLIWQPPVDARPVIKISQALVVSLDSAPASLVTHGTLVIGELG